MSIHKLSLQKKSLIPEMVSLLICPLTCESTIWNSLKAELTSDFRQETSEEEEAPVGSLDQGHDRGSGDRDEEDQRGQ